jgi:hypothetical protein
VLNLIAGYAKLFGNHFEWKPRLITTGEIIALSTLFPALTPFGSRELFQFSVQLFYDPTPLVLVLNNRRINRTWGAIGDHPCNVAVCGDHLEKLHFKRYFLEFNRKAVSELFVSPFDLLQMNIALLFAKADQAILLQGRHKELSKSINKLEIFRSRLPAIKQHRLCLNPFLFISWLAHFSEMIVLCVTIIVGRVYTKINRVVIGLISVYHMNNANTFD